MTVTQYKYPRPLVNGLHGDTSGRSTLRRAGSVWARQYGEHTLDVVAEFLHVVA